MVFAHFTAQGSGVLQLPAWALAYGVFAAAVVTILWCRVRHVGTPHVRSASPSRPSSKSTAGHIAVLAGQIVTGAGFVLLVGFCWFGPESIAQNVAPLLLIGVLWSMGGILPLILGPFWTALDPFALPARLGDRRGVTWNLPRWSPVPVFASYVVIWIAWTRGDEPRNLAVWLTLYGIAMVTIALRGGTRALLAVDALPLALDFTSGILQGRRARQLLEGPPPKGRVALVAAMLLAAVGTDRIGRARWFTDLVADAGSLALGAAMMVTFAVLTVVFDQLWRAVEVGVERARGESGTRPLSGALATMGGAVLLAQGIPIGLIQVQNLAVLSSDPFVRGWDLFGTAYWQVLVAPLSAFTTGLIQVGILLAGHLSALVAISAVATARANSGPSSPRARLRCWNASLPAVALTTVAGIAWTLLILGQ